MGRCFVYTKKLHSCLGKEAPATGAAQLEALVLLLWVEGQLTACHRPLVLVVL